MLLILACLFAQIKLFIHSFSAKISQEQQAISATMKKTIKDVVLTGASEIAIALK